MRIKSSPCFWCGHASWFRAQASYASFNACTDHEGALRAHAQLLFSRYRWLTGIGKSELCTRNPDTNDWD